MATTTDPQTLLSPNQDPALQTYATTLQEVPIVSDSNIYIVQEIDQSTRYITVDGSVASGENGYVQFNFNDKLAGSDYFVFDKSTGILSVDRGVNTTKLYTDNLYYSNGEAWTFGSTLEVLRYGNGNVQRYLPTYDGNVGGAHFVASSSISTVNLTTTGTVDLGDVSNVFIQGGNDGDVLTTDGAGTLVWAAPSGGSGEPGGTGLEVQFNNYGTFGADGNFTYNPSTETLSATNIEGLIGTATQTNITTVGTLTQLNVAGYVQSNLIPSQHDTYALGTSGRKWKDGYFSTGIHLGSQDITATGTSLVFGNINASKIDVPSGKITADIIEANQFIGSMSGSIDSARIVTQGAQPAITSLGTLSSLSVTGNTTSGKFYGSGVGLYSIPGTAVTSAVALATTVTSVPGANVVGAVAVASTASTAGTVTVAAQPNITSVGTLSSLSVSGGTATLGPVGNVKIFGGTAGMVLSTNGAGGLSWVVQSGAGGAGEPGGETTQIQFNDSATFNGSPDLTFTKTTGTLRTVNMSATGNVSITGNVTINGKTTLADPANIVIAGGTTGQFLSTNGSGVLSWKDSSSATQLANGTARMTLETTGNIVLDSGGMIANASFGGRHAVSVQMNNSAGGGSDDGVAMVAYEQNNLIYAVQEGAYVVAGTAGMIGVDQSLGTYIMGDMTSDFPPTWIFYSTGATVFPMNTAVPPSKNSPGEAGQIAFSATHMYICTAENYWKRITLDDSAW